MLPYDPVLECFGKWLHDQVWELGCIAPGR